jgi:hypothetical protein
VSIGGNQWSVSRCEFSGSSFRCANYAQIEVIKPHSAVLGMIKGVLDRWRWDSKIEEGARPQRAV